MWREYIKGWQEGWSLYEPELYSQWPGKLLENLEQPLIQADFGFVKITVADVLKIDSRGLWCSRDKLGDRNVGAR